MTNIYAGWSLTTSNLVGHMDNAGIVYNHWSREGIENSVGHVDKDGVVYNHWSREGIENSVGRVEGGNLYAAGAAFLLLNLNVSPSGSSNDHQAPVNEEDWRRERAEHEAEMQRIRNRNAIRAAKMQEYKNNPEIAAAAEAYAQQRKKTATVLVPIFFAILCIGGFKDMTAEAVVPVIAIVGLFLLIMTLIIRHKTYKNAFEQKVWELGESGFGKDAPAKKQAQKKPTQKTEDKSAQKPVSQPKQEQKPTPMPTPKPNPQPVEVKIESCPYCGAKFRSPVGVGTIRITCPNPDCKKQFMLET